MKRTIHGTRTLNASETKRSKRPKNKKDSGVKKKTEESAIFQDEKRENLAFFFLNFGNVLKLPES